MVRVSIYNEKGGSGKTTLTVMLASYLAYACGKRVAVVDFDYPAYHLSDLREAELGLLRNPRSPLSIWMECNPPSGEPYDVFSFPCRRGGTPAPGDLFGYIQRIPREGYDYLLYDFPGRFGEDEPVSLLAANGLLDFAGVPMDTDVQSRQSALVVADSFSSLGIPLVLFWNRVSLCESKGSGARFERGAAPFRERGLEVMEEMVRDIRKLSRESSEMAFVRSTLCFPERYVSRWSPSFVPFLQALKGRIDSSRQPTLP